MLYKDRAERISKVVLTGRATTLAEFVAVCRYNAEVVLSDEYMRHVEEGARRLKLILDGGKPVYGVNTGFGDNVRYQVSNEDLSKLQENILRSHACGMGQPMSREQVRALFLMLLVKIGFGSSGVRPEYTLLARDFLNLDLTPYVPNEGSIGGLSCQPYAALTLIGEGRFWDNGKLISAKEMLARHHLTAISPGPKEGFALISSMRPSLGPAMLAMYDTIDAIRHAYVSVSLTCEALRCTDKHFDERLINQKKHPESIENAAWIRAALSGSEIMRRARNTKVQDCTAVRMIPHIFGTVIRQVKEAYIAIMEEYESISDNPVFLPDGTALMGAGWDESYIASYCDALAIPLGILAKEIETFMERLVDSKLSGLPPFLVKNAGVNNGFMIVQYATAGFCADIANAGVPASNYHVIVSAGQEAPTLRGDSAARKLGDIAERLGNMVTLAIMTSAQAMDFIEEKPSPVNAAAHSRLRETVSFMENDDLMYERIEATERLVHSGELLDIYEQTLEGFPI